MNKLLLAGVAALSVLASAQAAPRLPNSLFNKLGCFNRDDDRIFRATDPEDQYPYANPYEPGCANRGGVRFFRSGDKQSWQYARCNARVDCEIRKIRIVRRNVYHILSYCQRYVIGVAISPDDKDDPYFEHHKLWLSKTGWHMRELEEQQ